MNDWHYAKDGEQHGPVSLDELRSLLAGGELPADSLVWRSGLSDWLRADQVPELGLGGDAHGPPPPIPGDPASPYAPPRAAGGFSGDGPLPERRRPWPISVVSIFWGLMGVLAIGVVIAMSLAFAPKEPTLAIYILLLGAVFGFLSLSAAVGLWRLRPWGRILAIVLAALSLPIIPIGTVVGILLLIYLASPGVRALYSDRPVAELPPQDRQALADVGRSGLGVAVGVVLLLCSVLFSFLIIKPIAIPNLLNAIQRGKQKRTMGDMRTIATAVESYAIDHRAYPAGGPTVDAIREFLEPTYIKQLPTLDGWNNPYEYQVPVALDEYRLESYGKDGVDSGPKGGPTTNFNHDIVFDTGIFVAYPERGQR